jgi:anti-sigma factor RsiW
MLRWWTCRRLRPHLVDAAAGTLEATERARVAAHLARCTTCAADVAALGDLPELLRETEEPPRGEEFWRTQRAAIMRSVRNLPEPAARASRARAWLSLGRERRWATWGPAVAAAMTVMVVLALRVAPRSGSAPEMPATTVEALDDPALLSLSDLAGELVPEVERSNVADDQGPLPELSNDELDALAQLVGVRER